VDPTVFWVELGWLVCSVVELAAVLDSWVEGAVVVPDLVEDFCVLLEVCPAVEDEVPSSGVE
jgi:hypothetical protein